MGRGPDLIELTSGIVAAYVSKTPFHNGLNSLAVG